MYRFALRPRWLLSHLLVALLVVGLASLGFWQLRRLDEKRDRNALIRARSEEPALTVGELDDPASAGEDLAFRAASASGVYAAEDTVLVRSRAQEGANGFWVLTPLEVGDGRALVVNRGWIPALDETDGSDVEFDTPSGEVAVAGILQASVPDAKPSGENQATIAHADLEWYDGRTETDLYPAWLQLQVQAPEPVGDLPRLLDPPEQDEGPHLGYAVQWFIFTTIAIVGYPIVLRRVARQREGAVPDYGPVDWPDDERIPTGG